MQTVILDFNLKAKEINEYFSFVATTTHLRTLNGGDKVMVSKVVHNVLKANLFLLLYNLIESSFKDALEQICIQITNDTLRYKDVIPEIKKMWIEKEYKNFNDSSKHKDIIKSEFIMRKIDEITEEIIKIQFNDKLSGNVETNKIIEINAKYGINSKLISERKATSLFVIKNKRNNLAHGNETFSECGEAYTISDLKKIKNESIKYMQFILKHIKYFINNKKYKIQEEN